LAIATGDGNDVEMDGRPVENGAWVYVVNRLYHLKK
jgi:hypothetical protein